MLVSTVMAEEGVVDDDTKALTRKISKLTAKLYRAKYGWEPHIQHKEVRGKFVMVNTYSFLDRDLIIQAIKACL